MKAGPANAGPAFFMGHDREFLAESHIALALRIPHDLGAGGMAARAHAFALTQSQGADTRESSVVPTAKNESTIRRQPSDDPLRMALTLDPEDTRGRIHDLVWSGFHADADIGWMITDEYLDPDELTPEDRAWIKAETTRACAAKRAAEAQWPAQTEYDRLEAVFAQLRSEKIIALHRAGNTLSDGHDDVREQWRAAGRLESGIRGCCFYHAQDLDGAVRSGRLYLAFSGGMIPEIAQREANTVVVGRRIVELLRDAGFGAQWSGNINERIEADLGQWRKRGPAA